MLPIAEVRALGCRPPPLPADAPVLGKDISKSFLEILARDGTTICLSVYKPVTAIDDALLFFNIHGGGNEGLYLIHPSV